ncbi:MAG: type I restriction enzyme HsdR N-terminal domain-containing protein [Bacteroidetes bacterium]|nr:type I restriction enzyme HsdR N-terminal domain-containing protein [Bacteroidota bacterium]
MYKLNLPEYNFKIRKSNQKLEIFDRFRKKYVALTPEEWVRQNFIKYLISEKYFPESLIIVEKSLTLNQMQKRADIVVYTNKGTPKLIVECKAPEVKITQKTFDQIARYNMTLQVDYLIVTNGIIHYCCRIDFINKTYSFLKKIPEYNEIMRNTFPSYD